MTLDTANVDSATLPCKVGTQAETVSSSNLNRKAQESPGAGNMFPDPEDFTSRCRHRPDSISRGPLLPAEEKAMGGMSQLELCSRVSSMLT